MLLALAATASADTYLEFSVTTRSGGRVAADYTHKIWVSGERARIDQSNAISWIIRNDLSKLYRLDHRDRTISEVDWRIRSGALRRMPGCLWTREGEDQETRINDWDCQARTFSCSGLAPSTAAAAVRPADSDRSVSAAGSPDLEKVPPRAAAALGRSGPASEGGFAWTFGGKRTVVCMSPNVPVQIEDLLATVEHVDPWSSITAVWRNLPEPRSFPVRFESVGGPISTTITLLKAKEVQVESGFYDLPGDYRSKSSNASQSAPSTPRNPGL